MKNQQKKPEWMREAPTLAHDDMRDSRNYFAIFDDEEEKQSAKSKAKRWGRGGVCMFMGGMSKMII